MRSFFVDLNLPHGIICNREMLTSRFPVSEHTYGHWNNFDHEIDKFLSPELLSWLETLNVYIPRIEIFHTEANRTTGWHIDMNPPRDWVKINWVWESGESYMEYSEIDPTQPLITKKSPVGTDYVSFNPNTPVLARKMLRGPTLINAGQPHRIYNMKKSDRWCLSAIPHHKEQRKRILWNDALEIFKGEIIW